MARRNIVVSKAQRVKRVYHYNLHSHTHTEFDKLSRLNNTKESRRAATPLRRSLSQLTPANVLTIKGYFDVKGNNLRNIRSTAYRYAKELNISIETAYSKDDYVLLIRLKQDWPVARVDNSFENV